MCNGRREIKRVICTRCSKPSPVNVSNSANGMSADRPVELRPATLANNGIRFPCAIWLLCADTTSRCSRGEDEAKDTILENSRDFRYVAFPNRVG